MLKLTARWFESSAEQHDYSHSDYIALFIILSVGALIRFWGLANVGLHGDEETMAMPALSILENGQPLLPSGMYYSRALVNIYLMSGSVWLFGESEWAFRLPSAIVGSLTGLAAFYMGRRFLPPQTNLVFVATVTLLPGMIVISQTARMYAFFVTSIIWFAACLFRWERDQRISSLILALVVWILCLHFQRLAIFAAPLFLFPGLSKQSWKLIFQGAAAFGSGWLLFKTYGNWIGAKYPDSAERPELPLGDQLQSAFDLMVSDHNWLVLANLAMVLALAATMLVIVWRRRSWGDALPSVLVGFALLAQFFLQYHAAAILAMFGTVFWLRSPKLPTRWLAIPVVLAGVITVLQLGFLHDTGLYPGRKLIGAVVGIPSVWPILRFLDYSPLAGLVFAVVLAFGAFHFASGRRLPLHFLFMAIAVWAPLLLLGYFDSYIPPRYAIGQLGYFLLCVFAGCMFLTRQLGWTADGARLSWPMLTGFVVVAIALINPIAFARALNPDYDSYPDHKGAAEYIESLNLSADAVLIAEDILQQSYYLKAIDYSLRPIDDAAHFSVVRDGRLVDQYTGVTVLGTGAELEAVLDSNQSRDVYVIGSGENFVNGRRMLRGQGIEDVLESERFTVVFEGRDGKTNVWKLKH